MADEFDDSEFDFKEAETFTSQPGGMRQRAKAKR